MGFEYYKSDVRVSHEFHLTYSRQLLHHMVISDLFCGLLFAVGLNLALALAQFRYNRSDSRSKFYHADPTHIAVRGEARRRLLWELGERPDFDRER
jgi:hypothetical protein